MKYKVMAAHSNGVDAVIRKVEALLWTSQLHMALIKEKIKSAPAHEGDSQICSFI